MRRIAGLRVVLLVVVPLVTTLAAGAYIIVAENPDAARAKWNTARATLPRNLVFGPYAGRLENDGEKVVLICATERIVRIIREMGLEPATPAEAREIMGLPRRKPS